MKNSVVCNHTELVRFVQNFGKFFLCNFKKWINYGRIIWENCEADMSPFLYYCKLHISSVPSFFWWFILSRNYLYSYRNIKRPIKYITCLTSIYFALKMRLITGINVNVISKRHYNMQQRKLSAGI